MGALHHLSPTTRPDIAEDQFSNRSLSVVWFAHSNGAGDVSVKKINQWFHFYTSSVALVKTLSSTAHASFEVVWLRRLIVDVGIPCEETTVINENNQGCIKLKTNMKASCGTKHSDVRNPISEIYSIKRLLDWSTVKQLIR